ncbi:hypothetical protein [Lachnobacterium bovis]|uniref:Cdc6-related protein, AAA superfamily ATPase n=1 Tax=Lachnobacterium bovis TaxID=140626 RepID=A0A1H9T8G0_9FIRM|nr:hypothetical protein [Lachnobacterium bovis]SER92903.1 Cdc6-related protein, AAA superfamily ATPase [Lachnobacterium bovis]
MSKTKSIQQAIAQQEGGAFQSLFDAYLYKKYGFKNIQTLGVQTGTNKPTKGTPDSYVYNEDGTYTLINYGSVSDHTINKIKSDILSCFDVAKLQLKKSEIAKIICGHISTNIHIEQHKELRGLIDGVEIELIGVDTLSFDLAYRYPGLAKEYLGMAIDTYQIFDINDFVAVTDRSKINAPLGCALRYREKELDDICHIMSESEATLVLGPSGVGKTRAVLEACRKYEEEGWNVLCIKSNSNQLFDDVRNSIEQDGKYLLFFDDANTVVGFPGLMSYIFSLPETYKIKTVFTVRDYASLRVVDTLNEYCRPTVYSLKGLSDDEIRGVLRQNLGIVNEEYLNRISTIACGNVRLAMLAGMKSIDKGLNALRNVEDIFRNYYDPIFDTAELEKDEILLLSLIELAGPIRIGANELFDSLIKKYLDGYDLEQAYQNLSDLELIDWYRKEIVKISDQSFGNYIFYYVFYRQRWISVSEVIALWLPQYRDKIIYSLNTVLQIFSSEDLEAYVFGQINDAWDKSNPANEKCYIESFYQVIPLRAIINLKRFVEELDVVEGSIVDDEEFHKLKKNNRIEIKEIDILAGFKYTDYYSESLELFWLLFEKRSDFFMDFYFAITNNLLYDKSSHYLKYEKEYYFVRELWNRCDDGNSNNFSILFLRIAEQLLETEFSYTESGRKLRNVSFGRMTIAVCDGIKKIRKLVWNALFRLREHSNYKSAVDKIIVRRHVKGLYEDATKELVLFDFNIIYPHIEANIDYQAAKIIDNYRIDIESLNMNPDERVSRIGENEEFRVCSLLTCEHVNGRTFEEDEYLRKKYILEEVKDYTIREYERLFKIYDEHIIKEPQDQYQMSGGLSLIFASLEENTTKYLECITVFFKISGNIISDDKDRIIDYLTKNIGYEQTKELLNTINDSLVNEWKYKLWKCVPDETLSNDIADDFFCFLHEQDDVILDYKLLDRYANYDVSFVDYMAERLLKNKQYAYRFLCGVISDDDASDVIKLFANDISKLVCIYISTLDFNIDYKGNLFMILYNRCPMIWEQYIIWLKDNIFHNNYEKNIINVIWNSDDYEERIAYAFDILSDDLWISNSVALLLFGKEKNENLVERKKEWLLAQLRKSIMDVERCKKLIYMVVISYPEWEVEYILEFTKLNNSVDDFESLYLFPLSKSWSGSEIPLINKRIELMKNLLEQLKGLHFLEHRKYLEDEMKKEEKYKERVEIREYIESSIYA